MYLKKLLIETNHYIVAGSKVDFLERRFWRSFDELSTLAVHQVPDGLNWEQGFDYFFHWENVILVTGTSNHN